MYSKFLLYLLISFNVFFLGITSSYSNTLDVSSPIIKDVNPSLGEQYIVGKPTIQAYVYDIDNIDSSSIRLSVNYKDVTDKCIIRNNKIEYTPEKKFKRGNQIIKLEVMDSSTNKNLSTYEWYFTVGTPIYNHYRGLLHAHTQATDGHGTYNDAFFMARDKAHLDFFAITEHSNQLDNNGLCTIDNATKSKEWKSLLESKDLFSGSNNYVPLTGFEMSYDHSVEDPIGHINVFNSEGFITEKIEDMTLENFYKLMASQDDLIGQLNHPCDKFGNFNDLEYSKEGDSFISLLEVGNGYNSDMSKNIRSHDMYQVALDKGWHVAPTANQDNHIINFGVANEFRTVILSTDLTEDALLDSLRRMRVYATEDRNIHIDYTINDVLLGSTIKRSNKLNFNITVIDNDHNDKIKKIQVISNEGKIIKEKKYDSNLAKLEFSMKSIKDTYYYVKVIQANDKISVTAPIWVK